MANHRHGSHLAAGLAIWDDDPTNAQVRHASLPMSAVLTFAAPQILLNRGWSVWRVGLGNRANTGIYSPISAERFFQYSMSGTLSTRFTCKQCADRTSLRV
jgi:hypothetical protein